MSVLPFLTIGCLAPPVVATLKRQPRPVTLLLVTLSLVAMSTAGILSAFYDWRAGWLLIAALPMLVLVGVLPARRSGANHTLVFFREHRVVRGFVVMVCTFVILVGGTEWSVYVLVKTGVVQLEHPIITLVRPGTEDWREALVAADAASEPDPILFWRPRRVPPYNAQRFQGPVVDTPKPDGVFRIMCFGDSNTDGILRDGGWPARLGRLIAENEWSPHGKRIEVVNAGVMGYSSHQGLMRFKESFAAYQPDLIFVSFGWNDAPGAIGKADRDYEIPPQGVVYLQRYLLRFRFYRLFREWRRNTGKSDDAPEIVGPRVSLADYENNLQQFVRLGKQHGIRVILLTRARRAPTSHYPAPAQGWRTTVPSYNRTLRDFVRRTGAAHTDVQAHFASSPELFSDECHFTAQGYDEMAQFLWSKLPRLVGK